MAVEKSVYQAPVGIDEGQGAAASEELEIEIVNPESVTLDDGSMEITIIPDADVGDATSFDANLAEVLPEDELSFISEDLMGLIDSDEDSRKEWADTFVKGLDVLGFKYEERTEPWEGVTGSHPQGHPRTAAALCTPPLPASQRGFRQAALPEARQPVYRALLGGVLPARGPRAEDA